jgi:hypothetical protein
MEVNRICQIDGRGYVLEIRTDTQTMHVYVSEKGRVIKAKGPQRAHRTRAALRALREDFR